MQSIKRIFTFLICITIIFTSINFSGVFDSYAAGVTEETYYYKQNDDDPWSKTTDPTQITYGFESKGSNGQNQAFIFTAVPGATYYYKQNDDDHGRKTYRSTKISYWI